jgi:antitoxin PrlF
VDIAATVTAKGQITIPQAVREALGLVQGDRVVFRVETHRAILARTPDLLSLAGAVPVPTPKRRVPWDEVHLAARRLRAQTRQ